MSDPIIASNATDVISSLRDMAQAFGFQQCSVCPADPPSHSEHLKRWLDQEFHGEMEWMERHLPQRLSPSMVLDNARSVICVRMDYLSDDKAEDVLAQTDKAYVSRYALGRDYHKLMRNRLSKLAKQLNTTLPGNYRALVDSAPVLERYFAQTSGLGWIGKNTMLINSKAGSWFFLGEIYTDVALPYENTPSTNHCGSCTSCLDICPTDAFVGPYSLDARRCISYHTIELKSAIPVEFRKAIGNRVFGCDDCQLVCPWNKFAQASKEPDFKPRHGLDDSELADLFEWNEEQFLERTAGSAIRRIGHERWLRNIAVGLGNANSTPKIVQALENKKDHPSTLVQEHVNWALAQHLKNTER